MKKGRSLEQPDAPAPGWTVSRCWRVGLVQNRPDAPAPGWAESRCWRVGLVVMIVFAGYLLFAHGCHGSEEEDDLVLWNPPPQGRGTSIATGLGRNKLDWLVCSRSWIACDT